MYRILVTSFPHCNFVNIYIPVFLENPKFIQSDVFLDLKKKDRRENLLKGHL